MDNTPDPEAIAREWARRHPEFMKPVKEKKVVKMDDQKRYTASRVSTKRYICPYCKKEFVYKNVYQKHQTRCTAGIAQDTIKPAVKEDATILQPPEARPKPITTTPAPEVPNAYAPTTKADGFIQTYGTPAKIMPPAPVPPAVSHKVDAVYYLIMAILSTLLLCGLIAAALGIKLLVGL